MTNDEYPIDGAVLEVQAVPEHRAGFWADLEATIGETKSHGVAGLANNQTTEMPAASQPAVDELAARRNRRRIWPMAAAAALLAFVGIGFLATRNATDPGLSTDLVAGTTDADQVVPLDGPEDATGQSDTEPANANDAASDDSASDGAASGDSDAADSATEPEQDSGAVVVPTPATAPLPQFDSAAGAVGEPTFFPADAGLPSGASFLNNSAEYGLTWWAVSQGQCGEGISTDIRYVNGSGFTQDVYEPQLNFTGEISHFTAANGRAAWLVSCGSHIELWVASTLQSGRLDDANLVWFGPGQSLNALMLWTDDEVSLSLLGTDGIPFSIEYEAAERATTRNGRPTRFLQESGDIEHRSTPAAVTADGAISYWPGISNQGAGECAGSFGRADTLWVRRLTTEAIPVWEPAVVDDTLLGMVTAVAIEPEFSQVAFADVCPGEVGRVFIATQRADGTLSNLRTIDLGPFVPGFADALHWIDSQTLRIETDNAEFGVDPVRFDFRLDDGRENGVIVQLD